MRLRITIACFIVAACLVGCSDPQAEPGSTTGVAGTAPSVGDNTAKGGELQLNPNFKGAPDPGSKAGGK